MSSWILPFTSAVPIPGGGTLSLVFGPGAEEESEVPETTHPPLPDRAGTRSASTPLTNAADLHRGPKSLSGRLMGS